MWKFLIYEKWMKSMLYTSWVFKISKILLYENFDSYDYNMKFKKNTNWYILVFYTFETINNPITIVPFIIFSYTWSKSETLTFMHL
jgi:hypothetical protein